MRRATWHEEARRLYAEGIRSHKRLAQIFGVHDGHIWKVLNPEKGKEIRDRWKKNNPDTIKAARKRYLVKHRARVLARNKLLKAAADEAKETGLPKSVILEQWGA